jgi:hypothetical protein
MASRTSERLAERLAEVFAEVLGEEDREVHADDVTGLDDAIDARIEEAKDDHPDADDIRGLDDAIDARLDDRLSDAVKDHIDGISWGTELDSDINEAVGHELDARLPDAITAALAERPAVDVVALLQTPEAQAALQTEVRKALVNVLHGLVANLFPVAQPVEQR